MRALQTQMRTPPAAASVALSLHWNHRKTPGRTRRDEPATRLPRACPARPTNPGPTRHRSGTRSEYRARATAPRPTRPARPRRIRPRAGPTHPRDDALTGRNAPIRARTQRVHPQVRRTRKHSPTPPECQRTPHTVRPHAHSTPPTRPLFLSLSLGAGVKSSWPRSKLGARVKSLRPRLQASALYRGSRGQVRLAPLQASRFQVTLDLHLRPPHPIPLAAAPTPDAPPDPRRPPIPLRGLESRPDPARLPRFAVAPLAGRTAERVGPASAAGVRSESPRAPDASVIRARLPAPHPSASVPAPGDAVRPQTRTPRPPDPPPNAPPPRRASQRLPSSIGRAADS